MRTLRSRTLEPDHTGRWIVHTGADRSGGWGERQEVLDGGGSFKNMKTQGSKPEEPHLGGVV